MTVEVEGGGGKLVDGGGDLRFLYGGFGGFQISLFSANFSLPLIVPPLNFIHKLHWSTKKNFFSVPVSQ